MTRSRGVPWRWRNGSAVVGRQETADGRAVGERRIERQPLAVVSERAVDVDQRGARFNGCGQVAVLMFEQPVHPRAC